MRSVLTCIAIVTCLAGCSAIGRRVEPRSFVRVHEVVGASGIDVKAAVDGAALPGATVTLWSDDDRVREHFTDGLGEVQVDLSAGSWNVEVALEGLRSAAAKVQVGEDRRIQLVAELAYDNVEAVTIACPPDFWEVHAPGRYTFYHLGNAWPTPAP